MRRLFFAFILLPTGVAACSQTTAVSTIVPVTALEVDPSEFLHGVTCEPGQMQSYVATVIDMSALFDKSARDPGVSLGSRLDEFALPSSAPTPCFHTLLFERIVVGRQYRAEVDGYDRAAAGSVASADNVKDIRPLSVGSRVMVDGAGTYVAPRWRTSCNKSWGPPPVTHAVSVTDGSAVATDGGLVTDGGTIAKDAGSVTDGSAIVRFPDAALAPFDDCRGNRLFDGGPDGAPPRPWLGGPVCAQDSVTVPFTACDPLVDTNGATR
jgi:hypothetical protein